MKNKNSDGPLKPDSVSPLSEPVLEVLVEALSGTHGAAYSDADGKYELLFSKTQKGALVGQHQVTVRTAGRDEIQVEDEKTGLMVTPS